MTPDPRAFSFLSLRHHVVILSGVIAEELPEEWIGAVGHFHGGLLYDL